MQAPTFHNTSASTPRNSSKLPINTKDNFSSFRPFNFFPMRESQKGVITTIKRGSETIEVPDALDIVKHEDFSKLHALKVNLDRWENDIYRYTGRVWHSQQQGYEDLPAPALHVKRGVHDLQGSLEVQEEAIAHVSIVRRGENRAVDWLIDRCSMFLCQECSDIFDYMSRLLVSNRLQTAERSWRYEKDLNVMCHALSPFDEYELDQSTFLAEAFSDFWRADDGDDQGRNEHVR